MFPPPPPAAPPARRWRLSTWVGALVGFVVVGALALAFTVPIGYYALAPGTVRPTPALVAVDDAVTTYEPEGEINFTTVSLRQATAAEVFLAWFDDDVELHSDEEINGGRSADETRQFNLALMDTSKQTAIKLALEKLGYDVPVTVTGALVTAVFPDTPADGHLEAGDTIVSIEGETVDELDDVPTVMAGVTPGSEIRLVVDGRDGGERTVRLVAGRHPDDGDRAFMGVELHPRDPDFQYPFAIDIDSGDVGGPSAGLAFTLGVIDVLTPGDLTGGVDVAVTGTIDELGRVGPIGGIVQKTAAVEDLGIDVFLVPAELESLAASRARPGLRIIGVSTLDEALAALDSLGGSGFALGDDSGVGQPR